MGQKARDEPSRTDQARGLQWRLVMAFGGLETMVKALLAVQRNGRVEPRALAEFIDKCRPDPFEPLARPAVSETVLDKIFRLPHPTDDHPLLVFLDLNPSNASTINDWMVKGKPIDCWAGAIKLSKALRSRGFSFIGPTIAESILQAIGAIDGHAPGCALASRTRSRRTPARGAAAGRATRSGSR